MMATDERIVCRDAAALADRAAAWLVRAVAAVDAPAVRLALSGGSTPRALYERLAQSPHRDDMPWDRLAVYWGDERGVGPDDEASNYRMAREALLDHVPVGALHRIEGEREDAAARYEARLRDAAADGQPPLHVVLLGMGKDGHTASLFPDTPDLDTDAWVVETTSPAPPARRISLTLAAINAASVVAVLVSGTSKAERLAEVWAERAAGDARLPISRVTPAGRMVWLMDEDAAARLP